MGRWVIIVVVLMVLMSATALHYVAAGTSAPGSRPLRCIPTQPGDCTIARP